VFRDIFALWAQPSVLPWLAGGLGLLVGSFVNVVINRLPKMMENEWRYQCAVLREEEPPQTETYNLIVPRSACPHCAHQIKAWENIPVLSWLLLRGRCSACKARISWSYPLVEMLCAGLCWLAAYKFGWGLLVWLVMLYCVTLLALSFIDISTQLLPDNLTLPLLWAGLLANSFGLLVPLQDAVLGAAAGYLILWAVYWIFKLVTGKEGMGYGDFKLLAAIGAWLGWTLLPLVIVFSSLLGSIIGISLTLSKSLPYGKPIPFGPYLAIAGIVSIFWGPVVMRAYLQL